MKQHTASKIRTKRARLLAVAIYGAVVASPASADAPRATPERTIARAVTVLPAHRGIDECFSAGELDPILKLDAIPDESIDDLLSSDDPWVIGVGLYLADTRGRPDILMRHPRLLDDRRQGPPEGRCSNDPAIQQKGSGVSSTVRMSIHTRCAESFVTWFGVYPNTSEDFARYFPDDADAWAHLRPWQTMLSRVRQSGDPALIAEAKRQVRSAPDSIQWAILAREQLYAQREKPLFSPRELRDAMRSLDAATRDAANRSEAPLPPDILWNRDPLERAEHSKSLYDAARQLLR